MLKAFTLIEIIVALAITSIISGLAYLSFSNISSAFKNEKSMLSSSYTIQLFQTQMMYEMDKCKSAFLKNNSDLIFEMKEGKSITYILLDEFVVRKELNKNQDTIPLQIIKIDKSRIFNSEDALFPVNAINLQCDFNGESIPMSFHKEYAAATLLEFESL